MSEKTLSPIIKDILDCKDSGITLRQCQIDWAKWTANDFLEYDIDVGSLPTGAGKSRCSSMLANYCDSNNLGKVAITTNNKMLQDQLAKDFPTTPMLKGAVEYTCLCGDPKKPVSCADGKRMRGGKYCTPNDTGGGSCPYIAAKQRALNAPTSLFNIHSYYYNDTADHKQILVIDEAHGTINFIRGMFEKNMWQFEEEYPEFASVGRFGGRSEMVDKTQFAAWLEQDIGQLSLLMMSLNISNDIASLKNAEALEQEINTKTAIWQSLIEAPEDMLVLKKRDVYRGNDPEFRQFKNTEQEYIYIKPLKIDRLAGILFPKDKIKKVVLLSATIGEMDIKQLGLDNRRVRYFEAESPIPVERRPVYYYPVASMASKNRTESIPKIAAAILKIADRFPDKKGIIHLTYEMSLKFKQMGSFGNRFMFHDNRDKNDKYQAFLNTEQPKILMASGMSEGIDLAGAIYGFQVIAMITKPNIGDDVNYYNLRYNRDLYDWETIRTLIQQCGRICRGAEDDGTTVIIDEEFKELFVRNHNNRIKAGKKSMFPDWWIKSLKW